MKTKCGKRSLQKFLTLTKDPKNLPLMPSLKKQARRFAIEATKKPWFYLLANILFTQSDKLGVQFLKALKLQIQPK